MFKPLFVLFFCVFFSFLTSAQKSTLLYNELENDLLTDNSSKVLRITDSIITNNIFSGEILNDFKALKVESMVHHSLLDDALKLSNKILENPEQVSEKATARIRIQRALIFEFFDEVSEGFLEFEKLENLYKKRPKDRFYGKYLFRKASFYKELKPVLNSDSLAKDFALQGIKFGDTNAYYDVSGVSKMVYSSYVSENEKKQLLKEALYDFKKLDNNGYLRILYLWLAKIKIKEENNYVAHKYLDSVIFLAIRGNDLHYKAIPFQLKATLFEKQNKIDSAYFYFKKFHELDAEINLKKQDNEVSELNLKNEIEKQKIRSKNSETSLTEVENYNTNLILLIIGIVMLLIIIGYLYYLVRIKNNELQQNLKHRELLLKELNHRVKNNLSLIISLIKFQAQEIDEKFYQQKFKHLENRIQIIAIAHEQFIYSDKKLTGESYNLEEYLQKIGNCINVATRKTNYECFIDAIQLNIDTALPIGILMNELLSNSIEHAVTEDELTLYVKIVLKNDLIHIFYSDSGTVFNTNDKKETLGLFIIDSMVAQLNGTLVRENSTYNIALKIKE